VTQHPAALSTADVLDPGAVKARMAVEDMHQIVHPSTTLWTKVVCKNHRATKVFLCRLKQFFEWHYLKSPSGLRSSQGRMALQKVC
jgi:hypothetical protein